MTLSCKDVAFQIKRKPIRIAALTALVLVIGIYTRSVVMDYWAYRMSQHIDSTSLAKAVALEPRSAEYRNLLGSSLLLLDHDVEGSLGQYKLAVQNNRYDSKYWLDLARVYLADGDLERQQEAIQQAVTVDPTTPSVSWEAANFLLARGDISHAMPLFSVVLRTDVPMIRPTLERCWTATHDVNSVMASLPPDPTVFLEFIRLLTDKNDSREAAVVWQRLGSFHPRFEARTALFYVDYLIQRKDFDAASAVWAQLAAYDDSFRSYQRTDNLIVDGLFSQPILNGGFDWRYTPASGAVVSIDTSEFHSGNNSLSITYDGSANDEAGLRQFVLVESDADYELSAWVKSEEISTADGPVLGVFDPYSHTPVATSMELVGTSPWRLVSLKFRTGLGSHLLEFRIARMRPNTLIRGRLWVDGLTLKASGSTRGSPASS